MDQRIRELSEQLDTIARLQVIAREQADPSRRDRWLIAIDRAIDAAREEHEKIAQEEARRPALRVIKGGLASAATGVTLAYGWLRDRQSVILGTAAAATAATVAVVVIGGDGAPQYESRPPGVSHSPGASYAPKPSATTVPPSLPTLVTKPDGSGTPVAPEPLPTTTPEPSTTPPAAPVGLSPTPSGPEGETTLPDAAGPTFPAPPSPSNKAPTPDEDERSGDDDDDDEHEDPTLCLQVDTGTLADGKLCLGVDMSLR